MVGHIAHVLGIRNSCMILAGQPKGRWSLGVTRRQANDNNKIGHQEIRWGGLE